jgi:hypothetical protein
MEKSRLDANPENEIVASQSLTERPKHLFQWAQGTATCSCGRWSLWKATLESAKRSHAFHRSNLPDNTRQGSTMTALYRVKRSRASRAER